MTDQGASGFETDLPERNTWPGAIAQLRQGQRETIEILQKVLGALSDVGHRLGDLASFTTRRELEDNRIEGDELERVTVLVVDDDLDILPPVVTQLAELGAHAVAASTVGQAELILARERVDVALIDLHVPTAQDGIGLCEWIRRMHRSVQIIIMSGDTNSPLLRGMPVWKLCKPFRATELRDRVLEALGGGGSAIQPTLPPPAATGFGDEEPNTPVPSTLDDSPQAKKLT